MNFTWKAGVGAIFTLDIYVAGAVARQDVLMATARVTVGAHAVAEKEYTNIRQYREYNAEDLQCVRVHGGIPFVDPAACWDSNEQEEALLTSETTQRRPQCLATRQRRGHV